LISERNDLAGRAHAIFLCWSFPHSLGRLITDPAVAWIELENYAATLKLLLRRRDFGELKLSVNQGAQ
jgi:hypothetical protein